MEAIAARIRAATAFRARSAGWLPNGRGWPPAVVVRRTSASSVSLSAAARSPTNVVIAVGRLGLGVQGDQPLSVRG